MTYLFKREFYHYYFLMGNCLIWYGTSSIHKEVFYLLPLIPILFIYQYTRPLSVLLIAMIFTEVAAINQQLWQFPDELVSDNHLLVGNIEGLPQHKNKMVRLGFRVSSINNHQLSNKNIYFRLSCYRHCPDFRANQQWQLLVRLKPANGYINPQGFDYEKWLYLKQYRATGYIVQSSQNRILASYNGIHHFREQIRDYLIENLDSSAVTGSLIALTVGDKSYLVEH